jgi:hypothetical protein
MALDALAGPLVVFGAAATPPGSQVGQAQDSNPHRGPSLFDQGLGIMDPRYPFAYQPGGKSTGTYGWLGCSRIVLIDQVPSTITTNAIAAAQVPTAGTPLTLASSTAAGITVGQSITRSDTGATVTGLLAIDGQSGAVAFGQSGGNNLWDPTKALARALQFTSAGDDSGGTATVRGYDIYWYPVTETVTLANTGVATSKKAFKYVASITPAGTLSGANLSVGQSDTIGFPMRVDRFQYVQIYMPDATLISATTGFTAAVTTDPATATTGDVRGTYAMQTASNNTRRLIISATPQLANIATAKGLVGVTQA